MQPDGCTLFYLKSVKNAHKSYSMVCASGLDLCRVVNHMKIIRYIDAMVKHPRFARINSQVNMSLGNPADNI